ncbi:MAG: hypothetical protein LBT46_07215 [Planctomycetaceae bacterium]|jgi:hypothetical protein|nr:hypothetical protein [Planctomycetaceae bacterium]
MPIAVLTQLAEVKRPLSPGASRVVFQARDEDGQPAAVFLCSIEPPNAFEQVMRESFVTVCSVEDMVEYPVGVSSVEEIDPSEFAADTFLYAAQENRVYVRSVNDLEEPAWIPYKPQGKQPNVHTHKLPFFRRSTIDIILPNRDFVKQSIEWIKTAVRRLEKDQADLEELKNL